MILQILSIFFVANAVYLETRTPCPDSSNTDCTQYCFVESERKSRCYTGLTRHRDTVFDLLSTPLRKSGMSLSDVLRIAGNKQDIVEIATLVNRQAKPVACTNMAEELRRLERDLQRAQRDAASLRCESPSSTSDQGSGVRP